MQLNVNRFTAILTTFLIFSIVQATTFQLDNLDIENQTIDVLYDFNEGDVAGFQFNVSGLSVSGASGGSAAASNFEVSTGTSTMLGFSFSGDVISEGSGLLTTLSYSDITGEEACVSATIATAPGGLSEYDSDGGACISTVSPSALTLGAFDSSGSLEVLYSFGGPVAGFQFDVTGLALTGASGGAAGDAGMTVSSGGATVVGFSLTNSEIPAGDGVLTVLAFSGVTADATTLSLGNFGAITDASGNAYNATASGSIDHPMDCAGDYYGSAVADECGVCNGDGPADNFDCDGTCIVDTDCFGECGGSAVADECGVCNGDGSECAETTLTCLLYTSDAADDTPCVDLGGRRII